MQDTSNAAAAGSAPAAASVVSVLKNRPDFLLAARAHKIVTPGFILQIRDRRDQNTLIRVGFTCSKKVGNAVARNRAKRRLREIARLLLPFHGAHGHDYVLIGRAGKTANRPFDGLLNDLRKALT
ncbi:MAG: ribonuclease P protein component [Paracoccaceae bacterium]